MQTILGAGGVIGNGLIEVLPRYTNKIRVASRNPKTNNPAVETAKTDLTDLAGTMHAVEGSEIVYLTVGLKYSVNVWEKEWYVIINNVIEACKKHKAKLVFIDNVYMLGKVDGWMTEETPVNPCSRKGKIRAEIAQKILDEVKQGNLTALIARSADFYGPGATNSVMNMLVCENIKKNKPAQWLCSVDKKHSYTYTPDAAVATAMLGNTPDAYNQIWHLPTSKEELTGKDFINMISKEFGVKPRYTVLRKWMVAIAGLFNPLIGEVYEMLYQNEYDYLFDSSKFEKRFNYKPTTYSEGITALVETYK